MSLSIQPEEQRSITVRAPAKINLHLGVGRPHDDGFHPLDTVFQAVGLYDDVRATDGDGTVTVEPAAYLPDDVLADLTDQRDNIVVRAARAARRDRRGHLPALPGRPAHREAHPRRRAGWPAARPTPRPRWSRWTGCGASTPRTTPCSTWPPGWAATCRSRCSAAPLTARAAVSACTRSATATTWWWVVVPSREGLATPSVYRRFDEMFPDAPATPASSAAVVAALSSELPEHLAAALHNDLEAPAIDLRPELGELIAHGEAEGALRGLVSGSGPTVVFLCESGDHARALADRLQGDDLPVVLVANGPVAGAPWGSDGQPRQPRTRLEGVRRPPAARRRLARRGRGRADRGGRPQRRRQDHAARGDDRPGAARLRPRVEHARDAGRLPAPARRAGRHPLGARGRARRPRRPRVGRRPPHPRDRRGAAGRRHPRPGRPRAQRRRAPPVRAGRAAARRPRPDRARRAHQPPRRRGRRLAGPTPGGPPVGAGRGDPRPLVPRRGLPVDVGGPRRRRGRLRGRLRGVRPGQGRASAAGLRHRGAPPEPGAQGARLAAPRAAGAHLEAEVPHRRRQHAHRGPAAAARPLRAAAVRGPAARQGRPRHRGRRPRARRPDAAAPRHLAAGPW